MPVGDVGYAELVDAVIDRLQTQVPYLMGKVEFVDLDDEASLSELQRGMGRKREVVKLYEPDPSTTVSSEMGNQIEFTFLIRCVIVYARKGSMSKRVRDADGRDVGVIFKDIAKAVAGQRLGILNRNGVEVGSGSKETNKTLQAMRFTLTARSRESRS